MSDRQTSPRRRSGAGCFIFLLVVFLLLSLGINAVLFFYSVAKSAGSGSYSRHEFEETLVDGERSSKNKIALIELNGVISFSAPGRGSDNMVVETIKMLRQAEKDTNVKAIVLHIDSPGGEVTAADTIYHEVERINSTVGKPIIIYMGSLTASGGYYIACGGDYLMANETTLTGSIGVIIQTINYRELFNKVGLEAQTFKSGEFKDMLSGTREMTQEEREYVDHLVMQMYEKFLGIVATKRSLDPDMLRNGMADGRIISAQDALTAKLIDATGYIEDSFVEARTRGLAPDAKVVRYEATPSLARALGLMSKNVDRTVKVDIVQDVIPQLKPGYCYYLWMPRAGDSQTE